jgi:hypothetical protein
MDNPKAVPQAVKAGPRALGLVVSLALVGLLVGVFAGSAVAAPIAMNGKVNACYKVKGKAKGAMRVVPAAKKCRKGERKLAWSVAGPPGAAGPAGSGGSTGTAGAIGATGATGPAGAAATASEANLQTKIAGLTLKVEGLEGILAGVTNGELTGVVDKLDGVTGLELSETVAALPLVDTLCTQTSTLTGQANLLRGVVGGLGLSPALAALGLLTIPTLPAALPAFDC